MGIAVTRICGFLGLLVSGEEKETWTVSDAQVCVRACAAVRGTWIEVLCAWVCVKVGERERREEKRREERKSEASSTENGGSRKLGRHGKKAVLNGSTRLRVT